MALLEWQHNAVELVLVPCITEWIIHESSGDAIGNQKVVHCVASADFTLTWREMASGLRHQKVIGDAIRTYRKAAKLSQEKLAEKAELHPVYIGQVERGDQVASVRALVRIAKALGVRLRDLVAEV